MYTDTNALIINNINVGQYIVQVEYNYPKIWGKDSGRNLAGEQSGTLLGIFPKIVVEFRKLTKSELELLAPIFDSKYQNVTYYDPFKKDYITIQTYTGDWKIINKGRVTNNRKIPGFSVSFIATGKRV